MTAPSGLGPTGHAIGTVLAGAAESIVTVALLITGRQVITIDRATPWRPDPGIIRQLFHSGLPAGIQGTAMNVESVLLRRVVGSLEQGAQAAYTWR